MEISALDALVKDYADKRQMYDVAKEESNNRHKLYKEAESRMLEALTAEGKRQYQVAGVGKLSVINKFQVSMPKDHESKKLLLEYLESKGEDVFLSYVTVNHQSLNSLYNQENELALENGQIYNLPGVAEATCEQGVRLTKEK